ncbi:MAG TPA: hypothetical protein VGM66_11570 [Candidatus Udaeobacter sp.]|jgi:hypothetical protein
MPTVADTLTDIERLQTEIECRLRQGTIRQDAFVADLLNFTIILYFSWLSHHCLAKAQASISLGRSPAVAKYYELFAQRPVLEEFIRWQNIAGLFVLWNIFEKFVRNTHGTLSTSVPSAIEDAYKAILKSRSIKAKEYDQMITEFNLARLTRNSLHQGGIYSGKRVRRYVFRGVEYEFREGVKVRPIRLLDLASTFWEHYCRIVASNSAT